MGRQVKFKCRLFRKNIENNENYVSMMLRQDFWPQKGQKSHYSKIILRMFILCMLDTSFDNVQVNFEITATLFNTPMDVGRHSMVAAI